MDVFKIREICAKITGIKYYLCNSNK